MTERPILFSAPMVRALLAGTKTQTRRIIKSRGRVSLFDGLWSDSYVLDPGNHAWRDQDVPIKLGDRLWVREAWRTSQGVDALKPSALEVPGGGYGWPVWYEVDGGDVTWRGSKSGGPSFTEPGKLRPSMFMPRWASRLTLTVTDVRVQRLQDCSEDDAFAEGIETDVWDMAPVARRYGTDGWFVGWPDGVVEPSVSVEADVVCRRSYETLWEQINGAGSWDANPWVAAYTFTVERRNIDAKEAA